MMKQFGGVMKLSNYAAVATIAVVATWNAASAQSTTDILQRLEALEKSNAGLKKENAELRDRNLVAIGT